MFVQRLVLRVIAIAIFLGHVATAWASDPAIDLFNQRILPILQSDKPSSCVQCHLSSVDLKNYILPSEEATFVSLRDQNLIDIDAPDKSKILELIKMGEKDLDEPAKLIHADMRNAELEAFAAWIEASSKDERLRSLPTSEELAKPSVPNEVIRHARKSRVVDSFVRNVWSQRLRCFPCHTPHEIDPENPRHQAAIKTRKKFEETYDAEMLDRLEIFRETPEQTLAYWITSSKSTPSDRLPLMDLKNPTESLLFLKPMSKLPKKKEDETFEEPGYLPPNISHMGGLKLHKNDQSYKSMTSWMNDYVAVVEGSYQSIDDLPTDNWYPSKLVVRMKDAPKEWQTRDIVQLFVFGEDGDGWTEEPIGFTQGMVTPRKIVNGALFLFPHGDTIPEGKLKRGKYLVKVYYDGENKIAANPAAMLADSDFVGQAEITKARWREGFRFAEVISGNDLNK